MLNSQKQGETINVKAKNIFASLVLGLIFVGLILLGVSSLLNSTPVAAQSVATGKEVVIADFNLPVDAGSAAFMSRVVSTAQSDNAAAIVIQMNTPGGSVSDMLDIIAL